MDLFRRWLSQVLLRLALLIHEDEIVDTIAASHVPMSLAELEEWAHR